MSSLLIDKLPNIEKEWDYDKNKDYDLEKITYGSSTKKYWWTCLKCKSSYQSSPYSRYSGMGCPYCAGKKINHTNSLESLYPNIAKQWHKTKNGELQPSNITPKSNKKVWWHCDICKEDYDMTVNHKTSGIGCPYCSGRRTQKSKSLGTIRPDLLKEWDYSKNKDEPFSVSPYSHKKVYWSCLKGHSFKAIVKDRHEKNVGCPYCSNRKVLKGFNDIWTTNPELAKLLNNPEDGYKYMQFSKHRVDWKCPNSDCNEIIANKKISDVNLYGLSCPKCSDGVSYPEKVMYIFLKQLNENFEYQKTFKWSNNKRYDFYIEDKSIIIETHGRQHYSEHGFYKLGGKTLKEEQENDSLKESLAKSNGIKNYIVIDCRKSNFEFIKNNIINSKLSEFFDLDKINWNEIQSKSYRKLN